MSQQERRWVFAANLDAMLGSARTNASAFTPQLVLECLLDLRGMIVPPSVDNRAPD